MGVLNRLSKKNTKITNEAGENSVVESTMKPTSRAKKTGQTNVDGGVVLNVAHRIIVKPLVTEKAALLEAKNKFSFIVARTATKKQIKQAIKEMYKTDAQKVQVVNVAGKKVRSGRITGRRSDYKKAVVTVASGSSIHLHDNV